MRGQHQQIPLGGITGPPELTERGQRTDHVQLVDLYLCCHTPTLEGTTDISGPPTGAFHTLRRKASHAPDRSGQGIETTVIPAAAEGRSMAASAAPAPPRSITSPTSRSGRRRPSATISSIAG